MLSPGLFFRTHPTLLWLGACGSNGESFDALGIYGVEGRFTPVRPGATDQSINLAETCIAPRLPRRTTIIPGPPASAVKPAAVCLFARR
jgi:hypothetical protein